MIINIRCKGRNNFGISNAEGKDMSKLEELIQQYCPDGVEYVKIGEIAQVGTGSSNGNEAIEDGIYPFFVRSQIIKKKDTYEYDEEAIIIPGEGGIGDIFHYINGKYALHQRVYRIHFISPHINVKFAFYYMKSAFKKFIMAKAVSSTVSSIRKPMIEGFSLPIPPLPVQEEAVRILDNFTELQAELQAELQKRKQQYNYYLDNLLNFNRGGQAEVRWMKLKDIGKVCMCKRILKSQTSSSGDVPFFKIGTFGGDADAYISQALFNEYKAKYSYPQKGDVLISAAGTIGRTIVFDGTPSYFQDSNIVWLKHDESIVLNSYLRYCYALNPWVVSTGGTIARLYNDNILEATIPVPSLANQQRIVFILDRFDTLTTDLTHGLPAEIEKRRQQYEYYRDKLLTFKRKEA